MGNAGATTRKARAEVENLIDEVVLTIQNGVTRSDGRPGFRDPEAVELRDRLRSFSEAVIATAGKDSSADLAAAVDAVVDTIRRGVIRPRGGGEFGEGEARELRTHLRRFADAIAAAAGTRDRTPIDESVGEVVRTIRSGLFYVYGRASYAAITADQLEAYLEKFADAVLTVVEKG
jgi:hypothetical protein